MPTFSNLNELFKYVQEALSDTMQNEVTEVVKETESQAIEDEVYSRYNIVDGERKNPYVYQRRGVHGGLSDPDNMVQVVEIIGDQVVLELTNVTRGQQEPSLMVADLVEYGDGVGGEYDFKSNRDGTAYQYLNPRPFTVETIRRLQESGIITKVVVESLRRKGFTIV